MDCHEDLVIWNINSVDIWKRMTGTPLDVNANVADEIQTRAIV